MGGLGMVATCIWGDRREGERTLGIIVIVDPFLLGTFSHKIFFPCPIVPPVHYTARGRGTLPRGPQHLGAEKEVP